MFRKKSRLGDGVIADKNDKTPAGKRYAEVACTAGTGIRLRSKGDSWPLRKNAFRVIGRSVIDDDGFEFGRAFLFLERVEYSMQHRDAVVRRDDDGEIGHAESPPSTHSSWPVIPLASSESRNAIAAATSSALIARRIGIS